jgi:hypothetical protein
MMPCTRQNIREETDLSGCNRSDAAGHDVINLMAALGYSAPLSSGFLIHLPGESIAITHMTVISQWAL